MGRPIRLAIYRPPCALRPNGGGGGGGLGVGMSGDGSSRQSIKPANTTISGRAPSPYTPRPLLLSPGLPTPVRLPRTSRPHNPCEALPRPSSALPDPRPKIAISHKCQGPMCTTPRRAPVRITVLARRDFQPRAKLPEGEPPSEPRAARAELPSLLRPRAMSQHPMCSMLAPGP